MVSGYCELIEQRVGRGAPPPADISDLLRGAISGTHRMQELIDAIYRAAGLPVRGSTANSTSFPSCIPTSASSVRLSVTSPLPT